MLEHKVLGQDSSKEYVVLLHGIGGNSSIFFPQIKEFRKNFNIIAINLPGHKNSPSVDCYNEDFSFELASKEVLRVLDYLSIDKAHFVGISLGSVLIHNIMSIAPERIETVVLGGAITRINPLSRVLLTLGGMLKNMAPHMWIYSLFAYILMPKNSHKSSRDAFIKEATEMERKEFLGWYKILHTVERTFENVKEVASHIPKLYLTGAEDHMFKRYIREDAKEAGNSTLLLIPGSGHVVNIDKPKEFNHCVLSFLKEKGDIQDHELRGSSLT
ncbi:alpha/beta hydrolase [Pontibacillus salipaludis]|uniref:alpha/beta fold hydrolase n=1 Tax=Pontibacillus salipaludis TaxID=1697394 RepID=UPI0031EA6B09